ncbi:MAG: hypothetical protein AAGC44_10015 [Planctomycetota bacterium]
MLLALSASTATARDDETHHLDGEARQIADWLIACQRAGWEDGDIETYLGQWHADAVLVLARTEEPGAYDQHIPLERLEPTRRLRMTEVNNGTTLSFSDIRVQVDGDDAVVNWRAVTTGPDAVFRELMRERYTLKRAEEGWHVLENRAWFLGIEQRGAKTMFTEQHWARVDAAAQEATLANEPRKLRVALLDAYRFPEAHAAAIEATELGNADADDWAWRGFLAVIASDAGDARDAFIRARELDPEIALPPYAKNVFAQPPAEADLDE